MNLRKLKHFGARAARDIKRADLLRRRRAMEYHEAKVARQAEQLRNRRYAAANEEEREFYREVQKPQYDRVRNIKPTKHRR